MKPGGWVERESEASGKEQGQLEGGLQFHIPNNIPDFSLIVHIFSS